MTYVKNTLKLISQVILFIWKQVQDVSTFDYRSLALFRIGLGLLILFDLAIRLPDLIIFHTGDGLLPANEILNYTNISNSFSLHLGSDLAIFQLLMFGVAALFAIMLVVGFKTKVAVIVSWILLVSLQNRNPIVLQGGDVVFRLLLFWAMFLPLGRVFSIDALQFKPLKGLEFKKTSITIIPVFLQIGFIYIFASLLKTGVEWTQENSATYYALSLDQFTTIFGEILYQFKWLMEIMTYMVLRFEFIVIFFIFFPIWNKIFRSIAFVGIIALHTGFAVTMHLGLFPFICIVMAFVLIRTELWELAGAIIRKLKNYTPILILYNPTDHKQSVLVKLIQVFGIMQYTAYESRKDVAKLEVIKNNSRSVDPLNDIIANSLILFTIRPFLIIPRVAKFFRNKISDIYIANKITKSDSSIIFVVKNFLALFFIMIIFFWNLGGLTDTSYLDKEYQDIIRFLRLDQQWNMFSPYPLKEDGWFVVVGTLDTGETVNLYPYNEKIDGSRPDNISDIYPTQRWRKFMMNLWSNRFSKYRNDYAHYLCRQWNDTAGSGAYLRKVNLKFYLEMSLPDYQKPAIEERNLGFIRKDGEYETLWDCSANRSEFK